MKKLRIVSSTAALAILLAACASPTPAPAPKPTEAPKPAAPAAPAATAAPAQPTAAPKPTEAPKPVTNVNNIGKKLPDDAAPSEQQVLVFAGDSQPGSRFMDLMASVYNRSGGPDMFSTSLVRLDKDFNVIPGSAKSWSASADGKTWTFKLREDLNWSDGTPLTADDFVASFRHIVKKETAYDFNWYFDEATIKNFSEAQEGKAKPEEIGVRAGANPKELVFETNKSIPYLPMLMLYAIPMQKAALEKYGPTYNSDPKTSVSCGAFVLESWAENRTVAVANKNLPDDLKPYLNKIIWVSPKDYVAAYQAGEVDRAVAGNAAAVKVIVNTPALAKDASQDVADFRVHYFFFDNSKPPFNNMKIRQAFAHLFDRETIMKKILPPPVALPSYSYLATGFPSANQEALKPLQMYSPDMAKKLYAESGVKITDKLTLQVRVGNVVEEALVAMAQVYAEEIKSQLGVDVEVKRVDQKVFTADMNAKPTKIQFGFISYGMDFLDPSNMLSVFKTDGRHNWNNAKFMDLITKAGPETDPVKRDQMFKDAEKLLVEEAAGVFAFQQFDVVLWRQYISGVTFKPGKVNTARGIGFPSFTGFSPSMADTYVTKDVLTMRPNIPK